MADIITVIAWSQRCLQVLRTCLRTFSAERPATTLVLIVSFCITVLPFVTATALMPLTILLDVGNLLATQGFFYVIYSLVFQVTVLIVIILLLFGIAFTIATTATILHKYNIISK